MFLIFIASLIAFNADAQPRKNGVDKSSGGSCDGRFIIRLTKQAEQAVLKDDSRQTLKILDLIRQEARQCRSDETPGHDPEYTPTCTLAINDSNGFTFYNSSTNFNIDETRRLETGAVLEVLDYPTVSYNSESSAGVRFRVQSNPIVKNHSAQVGEILYGYKAIFEAECH